MGSATREFPAEGNAPGTRGLLQRNSECSLGSHPPDVNLHIYLI